MDGWEELTASQRRRCGNEVAYCRPLDAASAHDLTAASLFIAEAPIVATADFDAEEGFRVVADCRFRTMAIVLRRRGSDDLVNEFVSNRRERRRQQPFALIIRGRIEGDEMFN
jgi:hypothetical protein